MEIGQVFQIVRRGLFYMAVYSITGSLYEAYQLMGPLINMSWANIRVNEDIS